MSERSWYRIRERARRAMRYGSASPLRAAVAAMVREQYPHLGECDHCGDVATWEWARTAKQMKAMRRKVRGTILDGQAVARRCSTHVPSWDAPEYRDARVVRVSEEKAS